MTNDLAAVDFYSNLADADVVRDPAGFSPVRPPPRDLAQLRPGAGVIVSHDERGNIAITPSPSLAGIITELETSRLL